jgi:hypothetical protein
MPGIPREVIEHQLKVYPDTKSVSQKPRRHSVERQDFICEEVRKLLHAGFIEEVHHPVWLANPVVVPKANGKLKGKYALGPFLSILVIECQRKCFCVNLCKVVDKVQIISKGMFLDLVHCFMD